MSLPAAALRLMAEKGLSAIDIAEIAEAIELSASAPTVDAQAERRRAADRERKRNLRNVCGMSADAPNDIYSNPDIISPNDDKSSLPPRPKSRRKSADGECLPDDWLPSLTPTAQKIVDGWPPGWLDVRLAEFRDHASDKGRKSKDWQAAFRKWLTNANEWGRQRNGNDRKNGAQAHRGGDGFMHALREAAGGQAPYPDADYG
jgi:hypothetical protein